MKGKRKCRIAYTSRSMYTTYLIKKGVWFTEDSYPCHAFCFCYIYFFQIVASSLASCVCVVDIIHLTPESPNKSTVS